MKYGVVGDWLVRASNWSNVTLKERFMGSLEKCEASQVNHLFKESFSSFFRHKSSFFYNPLVANFFFFNLVVANFCTQFTWIISLY